MNEPLTIDSARGARKVAMTIDIAAVAASTAANIAAAPATAGGWAIAAIAPVGLFLAIVLWHRSQGILSGRLGHAFNLGLAGIAAMAAWVSYGHLRHVAEAMGQTPAVAAVIPLVVDGAAILATVVVIGAGQKIAELTAAAEAAEQAEREATRQAENARRQDEAAKRDMEAAAQREAAERAERLAARAQASTRAGTTKTAQSGKTRAELKAANERAIADAIAEHPHATKAEIAALAGVGPKTVQRSQAWQDHKATTEVIAA